ncbi:hypothetical protein Tco_1300405 [Tanacetum coccineum]
MRRNIQRVGDDDDDVVVSDDDEVNPSTNVEEPKGETIKSFPLLASGKKFQRRIKRIFSLLLRACKDHVRARHPDQTDQDIWRSRSEYKPPEHVGKGPGSSPSVVVNFPQVRSSQAFPDVIKVWREMYPDIEAKRSRGRVVKGSKPLGGAAPGLFGHCN